MDGPAAGQPASGRASLRVNLHYSHGLDAAEWCRRHARDEVPDRYPYGLDRMAAVGVDPRPVSPLRGRVSREAAHLMRGLGGRYEWLEQLARRSDADWDLAWEERAGVPCATVARRPRRVATGVIWLTEPDHPMAQVWRRVSVSALRRADLVFVQSAAQLTVLRDSWRVPGDRLAFVRLGIDADFWTPAADGPEPGLVVSAGNDRHRDHATLVDAMGVVRRLGVAGRLELATHQPVTVPSELGVRHPSLPHGALRDLYGRAAVVALCTRPNLHVSGATALQEAMASGLPVVVTETPGMREYVRDGETGVLVPAGDPEALGEAIAGLLQDPDRAQELGRAARRLIEERGTTAHMAAALAGELWARTS